MDAPRATIQQYLMRGIQISTYAPAAGLLSSED